MAKAVTVPFPTKVTDEVFSKALYAEDILGTYKPTRSINWKVYSAANPPASGSYLVVAINKVNSDRNIYFSAYDRAEYQWTDIVDLDSLNELVVTHYVETELP